MKVEETTLEFLIKLKGVRSIDIAHNLNISKQIVNYWVKGSRGIPDKYIHDIAATLDVPPKYIKDGLSTIERLRLRKEKLEEDCMKAGISLKDL